MKDFQKEANMKKMVWRLCNIASLYYTSTFTILSLLCAKFEPGFEGSVFK